MAPDETHPVHRLAKRDFLTHLAGLLADRLAEEGMDEFIVAYRPSRYFIQVLSRRFVGSHYEVALNRDFHELGLHFEAVGSANYSRMSVFLPSLAETSTALGEPLHAEASGQNWARIYLRLPSSDLGEALAEDYARRLVRMAKLTAGTLEQAYAAEPAPALPQQKRETATHKAPGETQQRILADQIAAIRQFLRGRSPARPSDDMLCDWVRFCYSFELYAEGKQLFQLVDPSQVNPWYYERTKRLAKVCEIKTQGQP